MSLKVLLLSCYCGCDCINKWLCVLKRAFRVTGSMTPPGHGGWPGLVDPPTSVARKKDWLRWSPLLSISSSVVKSRTSRLRHFSAPPRQGHSWRHSWESCSVSVRGRHTERGLTSGTQEAPSNVDGGGQEAVPLGAAVATADHDVMGDDDAARGHTAVSCVIGHWTADTAHQTPYTGSKAVG